MKECLPLQMFAGTRPMRSLVDPVSNARRHKPIGGIWTSTYVEGTCDWERWCRSESFALERLRRRWLLQPVAARVFALETADDVERLLATYGRPLIDDYEPPSPLDFRTLDWEGFAREWDALWLSSPWIDVDGMPLRLASMMFYGWDCESTWWARWKFADVQPI